MQHIFGFVRLFTLCRSNVNVADGQATMPAVEAPPPGPARRQGRRLYPAPAAQLRSSATCMPKSATTAQLSRPPPPIRPARVVVWLLPCPCSHPCARSPWAPAAPLPPRTVAVASPMIIRCGRRRVPPGQHPRSGKKQALSGDNAEAVRPKSCRGGSEMSSGATLRLRMVHSAPGGLRFPQDNGVMRITPISR